MHAVTLNFNLVDVLMLAVLIRGFYVGRKTGFVAELLRLAGIVGSTFIILHYFIPFSVILRERLFVPGDIAEFVAFMLLMVLAIVTLFLIREGWLIAFKVEVKSVFNKWGGALLSLMTSLVVCSLLFVAFILLNQAYTNDHVERSVSRLVLKEISVSVYKGCYKTFIHPFFPDEPINVKVLKIVGDRH